MTRHSKSKPEKAGALFLFAALVAAAAVLAPAFIACGGGSGRGRYFQKNYVSLLPADSREELAEKAARVRPEPRQVAWQELEFQAFVHFGMNTFTDREWGQGTEDPALFNPTEFDAAQWVEAFKAAGMRGLILTAKHHDGFCLWPSRLTRHSVASSPWRDGWGDVVREAAEACRRAGLKFGVYLSPWDRHEAGYGDSPRYNGFFRAQLRELLTGYGPISEVWFDGACGEGPNGKRQVYNWYGYWLEARRLQPGAVISIIGPDARWVGNESGLGRESEWSVVPVVRGDDLPDEQRPGGIAGLDAQAADLGSMEAVARAAASGGRLIWYAAQVDVSIRPGWFHHPSEDGRLKSLEELLDIYYASVGRNAQLLLNVPADRRGLIHENDVRRLRELGDVLRRTFSVNLLSGARVEAGAAGMRGHGAGLVLDGDTRTYWTPDGGAGFEALEFRTATPVTFNTVMLQENIRLGQRVESFAVDVWEGKAAEVVQGVDAAGAEESDGGEVEKIGGPLAAGRERNGAWREVASGTTIGYKRLLRLPAVSASGVRLRITGRRAKPAIAEFGLFLDPTRR
jgi:alpha-L-fucosidase